MRELYNKNNGKMYARGITCNEVDLLDYFHKLVAYSHKICSIVPQHLLWPSASGHHPSKCFQEGVRFKRCSHLYMTAMGWQTKKQTQITFGTSFAASLNNKCFVKSLIVISCGKGAICCSTGFPQKCLLQSAQFLTQFLTSCLQWITKYFSRKWLIVIYFTPISCPLTS